MACLARWLRLTLCARASPLGGALKPLQPTYTPQEPMSNNHQAMLESEPLVSPIRVSEATFALGASPKRPGTVATAGNHGRRNA